VSENVLLQWHNRHSEFLKKIRHASFDAIVFDYDGTLCRSEQRFHRLEKSIVALLRKIVEKGITLGVVTGRGKSVRVELQKAIPKKYWKEIYVGYYNGSDIGRLNDNSLPKTSPIHPTLKALEKLFSSKSELMGLKAETRPMQLTIDCGNRPDNIRASVMEIIERNNVDKIAVLQSSHSLDIVIQPDVSKVNILKKWDEKGTRKNKILCIGDMGEWPGNDFELLSTEYSLSVDAVSPSPNSCWNLSRAGVKGLDATLEYLSKFRFYDGYCKMIL
jgi:hydroxymethylpyrimidine pyrophosphatase-like HAD family hydrolase